ncbi:acyl-CoA carboxylase subunit beta [Actinomycetospora atypica]|uniref:Acyl-CoA carboxylase subunit beta n=1 Tax=Actinomycetospora atypica TaxID=1290095 RepID=A0ABV9YSC4_9PSEU
MRLVRDDEVVVPPPAPPDLAALTSARAARRRAIEDGEPRRVAGRRDAGRLTARERLDLLLDPGSFTEIDTFRRGAGGDGPETDGVVAGSGTVGGRRVFVFAQDAMLLGGSLGAAHAATIHKVMDLAVSTRSPLIGLHDSGGARIQEGAAALDGYGGIFRRSVAASGVIPQIAVLLGPCAGGAAYAPALADVVVMVRELTRMYLTGPDVVRQVTGADVTHEELGGADMHGSRTGLAHVVADDEETALADVRTLVGLLPANNDSPAAVRAGKVADDTRPRLREVVPTDPATPYDVTAVIGEIVDGGDHFELSEEFATNVVTTLGRVRGELVGIVANQPSVLAGVLDRAASEKAARFVRFCDAFGVPLLSLVDVPGFLPGLEQEHQAVIRHGAQLLYAYCEATVPRISVVLRKAYGGAYIVMDSRSVGCDLALAWPTNEVAVLGAESAVDVLFRRELAESDEPDLLRREYEHTYRERYLHPDHAAAQGLVDDVIDPADTRSAIVEGLAMLRAKRADRPDRKHGNIPL